MLYILAEMALITEEHSGALMKNMEDIKQHIRFHKLAALLTELEAAGVINNDRKKTVCSMESTANKVELLVHFIRLGTEEGYNQFLAVLRLRKIQLHSLADKIEGVQD